MMVTYREDCVQIGSDSVFEIKYQKYFKSFWYLSEDIFVIADVLQI